MLLKRCKLDLCRAKMRGGVGGVCVLPESQGGARWGQGYLRAKMGPGGGYLRAKMRPGG